MALHHKALTLFLISFAFPLSGMEEERITIHTSQSKGEVKKFTSQPSVAQIWELADHLTAKEYVEEFKKINCFKFRPNSDVILGIKSNIVRVNGYKQRHNEEIEKIKNDIRIMEGQSKSEEKSQEENPKEENPKLKELESEIKELEAHIEECDKQIEKYKSILSAEEAMTEQQKRFYDLLEAVAQNPAGKILLYRLLIELHRPSTEREINIGREPLKTLDVEVENKWSFDKTTCTLKIGKNNLTLRLVYANVIKDPKKDSVDIDFFHELLHWFHSLVSLENYSSYINGKEFQNRLKDYFNPSFTGLPKYLWMFVEWGGCSDFNSLVVQASKINNTELREGINQLAKEKIFVMEELLTVMGMNNIDVNNNHGEELSENLYRALGGHDLRLNYCEEGSHENNTEWDQIQRAQIIHNLQQTLHALNLPREITESLLHALSKKE